MKRFFLLFTVLFLLMAAGPGQRYTLKHQGDGVEVYYRWKKKFLFFFHQKKTLDLYLANKNDYRVMVYFSIDVYKNAVLYASSDSLSYCIPPNYEISGRFRGLMFDSSLLPAEDEDEENKKDGNDEQEAVLTWEISDFRVEKNNNCETKANWRE